MLSLNLVLAPSFPVTWKTAELPLNEIFRPCLAAVVSPSLFYLFNSSHSQNPCTSLFYPYLPLPDRIVVYFYCLVVVLQRTSRNWKRLLCSLMLIAAASVL